MNASILPVKIPRILIPPAKRMPSKRDYNRKHKGKISANTDN